LDRPLVVDLDVADHKVVHHSHLEAADIDCIGLALSDAVGRLGDGFLHSFFVHEHILKTFVDFAAAVAVGTSEPVAVVAAHTEVVAAVSIAAVAAVVEVAAAVAVGIVAAGDMAAAEGLRMVVAGC